MIHAVKTESEHFEKVVSGEKTFEARYNDRNYKVGDLLALNEIENNEYTGRSCLVYVDYILDNINYCKDGYIIMSIKPCSVYKSIAPRNPIMNCADYSVPLATAKNEDGKQNT